MKWYGSIDNRLEENRMFTDEIKVGTGVTEYFYSDRHAYEVIAVKDQKHVTIREYSHKMKGQDSFGSNNWELISNPENPTMDLVKRGKYWYSTRTVTREEYEAADQFGKLSIVVGGYDPEQILAKGRQTKYFRLNVSFGVADYYYDYSF